MQQTKIWIIILVIVVLGGLFPPILSYAEGDGGGGAGGIPVDDGPPTDIPDLEYSFENAPYPGNYGKITESSWQDFLNRAESLGHTEIKRYEYMDIYLADDTFERRTAYGPIFYSTNGTDMEEIIDIEHSTDTLYYYTFVLRYKNDENINILNYNRGHETSRNTGSQGQITWVHGGGYKHPTKHYIGADFYTSTYYRADITEKYQEKPNQYNADPTRGYGMYFLKPAYGEWVNIPHALGVYRDYVEIEIQVPQKYEWQEGYDDNLFYYGDNELSIRPNFAIQLHYENVRKIHGAQVAGRDGTWILPHEIKLKQAYYSNTYPHTATFTAKVPIDHSANFPSMESIITADLYIYDSYNSHYNYSVNLPEYHTWTRYLTYLGTVDADGDGYDDRTGHPVNQSKPVDDRKADKPNRDDYPDTILGSLEFYWDTMIYYIKMPFIFIGDAFKSIIDWINTSILGFIDSFIAIFERLFSFLPYEVVGLLGVGFMVLMIITVVKAIRGD